MTGKKLRELVNSGINPVIEFTNDIDGLESRWNHGMRGYVVGVSLPDEDKCIAIKIDEKEYTDYNKKMEIANWRKEYGGEYIYKWSDIHKPYEYEEDYIVYIEDDKELYNFKILDDDRVRIFNQYKSEIESDKISYVEWLENKYIKH
jgi:hypothetical protein